MTNNYDKYLPIGSVVILKNGKKRLMITGYAQIDMSNVEKIYDYCGCIFPEGVISTQNTLLFNHDDIQKIFCIGFKDEEQEAFNKKLIESLSDENKKIMLENARKQVIES